MVEVCCNIGHKSTFDMPNNKEFSKQFAYRLYENYKRISSSFVDAVGSKLRLRRQISAKARIIKPKEKTE